MTSTTSGTIRTFGPQVFFISITGLKPDTEHKFYLLDKDVTVDCAPITGTNVTSLFGYKLSSLLSLTSSKIQNIRTSYTIGSPLISGINGKLEFYYFFSPTNSPYQLDGKSQAKIPESPQKVYVKSLDGNSYAESSIEVKTKTVTNTVYRTRREPGSCFLADQKILMADGTLKAIVDIKQGDIVQGRWGVNNVTALDVTEVGNRFMYLLNDVCFVDPGHPIWTKEGWQVIDKQHWLEVEWNQPGEIMINGKLTPVGAVDPCLPEQMGQVIPGKTLLGTQTGWDCLWNVSAHPYDPETKLYSLVLDGCRTMYVDGYCFSGWADGSKVDYQSKIGT